MNANEFDVYGPRLWTLADRLAKGAPMLARKGLTERLYEAGASAARAHLGHLAALEPAVWAQLSPNQRAWEAVMVAKPAMVMLALQHFTVNA